MNFAIIDGKHIVPVGQINYSDPFYQNKPITYGFITYDDAKKSLDDAKKPIYEKEILDFLKERLRIRVMCKETNYETGLGASVAVEIYVEDENGEKIILANDQDRFII